MTELIRDAIEACYAAFERPAPQRMEGCPDCIDSVGPCALVSRPLRELTAADLDRYAAKAMTTVGSAQDFRYFWPRIAELAIGGELLTSTEIVFGKLEFGEWHTWPEREQEAVAAFTDALSARFASEVLYDVDDWVCALGMFVPDITPHLAPLLEPTAAGRTNLEVLYEANERLLPYGSLQNAFWDDSDLPGPASSVLASNQAAVVEFLRSDAVLETLTH